jgi:hypothetical protein
MRNLIFIPLVLGASLLKAQNLVPNPSFEEYTECPWNFGQWADVVGWTSPYNNSADYFNACAGAGAAGVPLNSMGEQDPAEGTGYMGLYTYALGDPTYREFISAQLVEPLQPGVPVYLCFKVALGGFGSSAENSANYTCSGVGMKFFNVLPTDWSGWYEYLYPDYPNSAAIHLEQAITDTSAWVTVSGTYVPDSAYTQIVIGNFFSDSLSDPFIFDMAGYGVSNAAYVFIDQVSVSFDPSYCTNWTGVARPAGPSLLIGPNPFGSYLRVSAFNDATGRIRLRLMDATGRIVRDDQFDARGNWILEGNSLVPGYYTLLATNTQGASRAYALVHVSP